MRKSHYLLTLLAATAVAACSSYEETTDPATAGSRSLVKLHAEVADKGGTRANINVGETSFTAHWESGDALGIAYSEPGTTAYRGPERFTYDGGAFAFEGELPTGRGDWQYRAFYPYAPLTGTTASVPFGNLRTQRGNAFNCAADALVAETLDFSDATQGLTDDGEPIHFRLRRLTSILNLNLTGGSPDDRVRRVLLTSRAGEPISAASFDFDISRMGEDAALSAAERSEVIALSFEPGTAPGSDAMSAFFNVAPGNYSELTFEVITESKKISRVSVTREDTANPFVAGKLYKKEISAAEFAPLAAPSLDWPGQDMDAVHEITTDDSGLILDYPAAIDILTPGGIASLAVDIVSPALNGLGLSRLDLFNETELPGLGIPYADLGLSSGVEVQYRKSCVFDITGLVPLIAMLPGADPGSLHTFEVAVTDLAGQTTTQKLTFRIPGATIVYDDNADLWANTASLSISDVNPAAQSVVLQYRAEGETAWNTAQTTPLGQRRRRDSQRRHGERHAALLHRKRQQGDDLLGQRQQQLRQKPVQPFHLQGHGRKLLRQAGGRDSRSSYLEIPGRGKSVFRDIRETRNDRIRTFRSALCLHGSTDGSQVEVPRKNRQRRPEHPQGASAYRLAGQGAHLRLHRRLGPAARGDLRNKNAHGHLGS